jgi:uncharacterized protein YjcR
MHPSREKIERLGFQMWQDGMLDKEIAKDIGCHRETVLEWRKRHGLESNVGGKVLARLDEMGWGLYRDGCNDQEIAREVGCKGCTVHLWRKKRGLVTNCKPGSESWKLTLTTAIAGREAVMNAHAIGLTDEDGARELGISVRAFGYRRYRLGLKANKIG